MDIFLHQKVHYSSRRGRIGAVVNNIGYLFLPVKGDFGFR